MKMKPNDPKPAPTAMASTKGDLRQLKQNSSATVAELKAFLRELKGRSPQEMLGIVASSQLLRAIGVSSALVFVGIVIFTAVPFALGGKEKPETTKAPKTAAVPPPASSRVATPSPAGAPGELIAPGPDPSKLGVDETKNAPPNQNPLENNKDSFLDGLD